MAPVDRPRLIDFEHQWVPVWPHSTLQEIADLWDDGWSITLQTRWVTIPAVTHPEYKYTATTGWLTESESPGEGWTVVETRTVDVPEVVCGVPSLKADRSSLNPGGSLNLTALGFLNGENVDFVMHSTPVLLGTVAADGTETASLPAAGIPRTASLGTHTVVATGQTSGRTASVSIEVVAAAAPAAPTAPAAPAAPAAPSSLASTGGQVAALLGTAGALTLAGIALVALRRRGPSRA